MLYQCQIFQPPPRITVGQVESEKIYLLNTFSAVNITCWNFNRVYDSIKELVYKNNVLDIQVNNKKQVIQNRSLLNSPYPEPTESTTLQPLSRVYKFIPFLFKLFIITSVERRSRYYAQHKVSFCLMTTSPNMCTSRYYKQGSEQRVMAIHIDCEQKKCH